MPNISKQTYAFYITLGLIAILSMWLLKTSTIYGAGLINDSTAYIAGARSLLQGTGYSQIWLASELQPMTHYPPLFSLLLAFVGLLGIDPSSGARWVNIFFLGANVVLIGAFGRKIFNSKIVGVLFALLFVINSALFRVHSFAISEPSFLFFCLVSFLILAFYLDNGRKKIVILFLGLAVGFSILDRYVGFALFGSLALALVFLEDSWKSKVIALGIYLAGSAPLPLAWMVYNARLTGIVADRGMGWHPIEMENLLLGIANLSHWFFPLGAAETDQTAFSIPGIFLAIIFGVGLLLWTIVNAVNLWKGNYSREIHPVIFAVALYAWMYPISVLTSITMFDPTTKLQDRILSPFYLPLLILLIAFGAWMWRANKRPARYILAFAALLIFVFGLQSFYQTVLLLRKDGQGYASRRIRESSVIEFVRQLPDDVLIYTDSPPSIYSGTDRASYIVFAGIEDAQYQDYYLKINEEIRAGKAVLVLFDMQKTEDPLAKESYKKMTFDAKVAAKFGAQRAFMGQE